MNKNDNENILLQKLSKLKSVGETSASNMTKPETEMHNMTKAVVRVVKLATSKPPINEVKKTSKQIPKEDVQSEGSTVNALKLKLKEKEQQIKKLLLENAKLKSQLRDEMDQKNILFSLNVELQRKVIGQFSNIQSYLQDLTTEVTEVANASAERNVQIKAVQFEEKRFIWAVIFGLKRHVMMQ
ncbi:uncharacterized protein LOC122513099 [Leptopilina heterotoma]|uniref:uncharacterized protein LOC122513099 n=1 Tax=Leptopilina heterotoma TaxID=63436 RepID=UPI001CA9C953|nr:uncharacterized protein LOC122513099 [Leptopilina heterotoma]